MVDVNKQSLVNELPEGVDDLELFGVAVHEVGHALMADIHDIPIEWVRLEFGLFGGNSGGTTQPNYKKYAVPYEDGGTELDKYAAMFIAGLWADAQVLVHYLGWDLDRAVAHERDGASHDYSVVKKMRQYLTYSVKDLEKESRRMVNKHWTRIVDLGTLLYRKKKVVGRELTA